MPELFSLANSRWNYTCLGDSRTAQGGGDTNGGGKFTDLRYFPNFANALSGHRMRCIGNWGVAGDRTDQMLTRLSAALAGRPNMFVLWGGVNDISQGYTGAQAYANLKTAADTARALGILVVLVTEAGATGFTSAQIKYVNDLNGSLRAYANRYPNVILFDEASIVRAPTTTDIQFRAGTVQPEAIQVHRSQYGGYLAGKEFAKIVNTLVPPARILPYSVLEKRSTSNYDLEDFPLFSTPTGGTNGTGFTGPIPSGYASTKIGNGSAVLSNASNADGFGNDLIITAAGGFQEGGYINDWGSLGSRVSAGDVIEALAEFEITSPVKLQGVAMDIDLSVDGNVTAYGDGYYQAVGAATESVGPNEAYTVTLCTPPITIPAFTTMNYLLSRIQWQFNDTGGSAVIKVRRWGFRKIPTT